MEFLLSFCQIKNLVSSTSSTEFSTGKTAIFPVDYAFSTKFTKEQLKPDIEGRFVFGSHLHFSPSFRPGTAFKSNPANSCCWYAKKPEEAIMAALSVQSCKGG